MSLLFDVLLALGILAVAWNVVTAPRLFEAVVFFVAFGLMMALCWMRLGAIDVALTEAAIGAGLSGALLMTALRRMDYSDDSAGEDK